MPVESFGRGTNRVPLSREPVPAWVMHEPFDRPEKPEEAFIHNGLCKLLQDIQVDLTGPGEAWHYHSANHVVTQQGAEAAAYVAADFDPQWQRLEIHFVRVLRGANAIDRTNIEAFDILRRERDLEKRILDGRLTAALVVPDVRPGDVVEVALTLYGSNPVLKGHYSNWVGFDALQPILDQRHRVRHGKTRQLALKPLNNPPAPMFSEQNGITELRWRTQKRPKHEYEAFSSPWLIQGAVTQLSDGGSWSRIADLFTRLYDVETIPASLTPQIETLAAAHPEPSARAAETLRFVQKRLRYLALSLGEGGLMPRSLEDICATGYGDCKDAARLYVAVAKRLGIDACPALVSTSHGQVLDTLLPSASVFNHCIVRVKLDGKTYWLDPTIRSQSGTLDVIVQAHIGWALPLTEKAALEQMNTPAPAVTVEVDEDVDFGLYVGSPATFKRQTVYTAWRADHMRDTIANQGLSNIAEIQLKELRAAWPEASEANPIRIEDAPEINKLTTFEHYKLPGAWRAKGGSGLVAFGTQDTVIGRELGMLPATQQRKTEVHLGHPRIVRRFVRLRMPRNWRGKGWDTTMEIPGLTYRTRLALKNKRLIEYSQLVAISASSAPANAARRYNEIVHTIREKSDLTVSAVNVDGEIKLQARRWSPWRTAFIVFWLLMVLGSLATRH